MSLFGLAFVAVGGLAYLGGGIKDAIDDGERRERAVAEGKRIYTDGKLRSRLVSDNRIVTTKDIYGVPWICDLSGNLLFSYVQERRDEESKMWKAYAEEHGWSTYPDSTESQQIFPGLNIKEKVYIDLKTDSRYVIIKLRTKFNRFAGEMYMNPFSGELIRYTDNEIDNKKAVKLNVDEEFKREKDLAFNYLKEEYMSILDYYKTGLYARNGCDLDYKVSKRELEYWYKNERKCC